MRVSRFAAQVSFPECAAFMQKTKSMRGRWWLGALLLAVALAGVVVWVRGGFRLQDVTTTIAGFNPIVVFILMATLPVAGFSVSIMYLVAGMKFGPLLGGALVAAATAVHLLATHWICQTVLRGPLQRYLAKRNHRLPHVPEGENASVAAMAALVPGLPYFARNYLLALTDVPLPVYFWVCLPIYVVRSFVAIMLGDLGTQPDRKTLMILVGVYAVKLSICAYLIWRIRRRIRLAHAKSGFNASGPANGHERQRSEKT
jgi:uncharacterized membrane protein YdjX (TVP38/TMEM64 family)